MITSTAVIALAMYIVVAEKQGVAPAQLRGQCKMIFSKNTLPKKSGSFPRARQCA